MGDNSIPPTDLEAKRLQALALRMEGRTYRQIAEELPCSPGYAHELVREGLEAYRLATWETVQQSQTIAVHRLDMLYQRLERKMLFQSRIVEHPVTKVPMRIGDPQEETVKAMLEIISEHMKITGGYAPAKVKATVTAVGAAGSVIDQASDLEFAAFSDEELREYERLLKKAGMHALPAALDPANEVQAPTAASTNGTHASSNGTNGDHPAAA